MKRFAGLVVGVGTMIAASTAGAVEREQHAGIDVGGTALVIANDKTDIGTAVGAHWTYGVTDMFNLLVEADGSVVAPGEARTPKAPHNRPAWAAQGTVGAAYVLDILQWVPYFGVLAGAYTLGGGTLPHTKAYPGVALAVGLDYRVDPHWCVGVAFRQHMLLTDVTTYPSFTQLFARVEFTWGW